MAMTHHSSTRSGRRLALWIAAAGCGLWLLAQAAPADAQASRTRPGGGGSSSSASSGGSSSSSSGGGSSSASSSSGSSRSPVRVQRTRPPGDSSGSPTVIDKRRPPERRSGSVGGHFRGHTHSFDFFWPYRWGWWLGWDVWYPSWGYPYGYYGYGYGAPYPGAYPHRGGYPSRSGPGVGALDTDVWPARTQVWIDGSYVGFVDQFDGWPRYLWLPAGTYDVVFYLDGFKTLARQYTVYPGLVIDVEDRLEPGEAIHPNELAPKETPVRDARERAERERRAAGEPEWRRRVRAEREQVRERPPAAARDGGRVYLGIRPADAAVYLDGEFVGTGAELAGRRGLAVEPGRHELSVVHPGYATHDLEFEVEPGGEVDLDVALEASV